MYEKLYFHEIESREKLNSRLQITLTFIVSFIGVLAFMFQNYEHQNFSSLEILFILLFVASILGILIAIYFFIRSWHNNIYTFIPAASDTDKYHSELQKLYEPYGKKGEKLIEDYFEDYISSQYIKCSSANTECNDRRSIYVHKTNTALIVTAIIAFFAFLIFNLENLDKSNIKKPTEVIIINPVKTIMENMTKETPHQQNEPKGVSPTSKSGTPPPPPPQPVSRIIKEGVEVVKQKDKKL